MSTRRQVIVTSFAFTPLLAAACWQLACTESAPPSAAQHDAPRAIVAGDCLAALDDAELEEAQQKAQAAVPRERAAAWVSAGQALVRIARTRTQPELYAHVEACANRALEAVEGDADALHLKGIVMMDAHRFSEARALAEQLVARDGDDVAAWGLMSDASLELGKLEDAARAAQRMLDLKPSLLSYGRSAHLRALAGDTQGALELYSLAIGAGRHLKDREPRAWMMVEAAQLFLQKGDIAGAEAGFDAVLRELPGYAPALAGKRSARLLTEARAKQTNDSAEASL
jgi:tetratricopeptide (TPR) repeat protein